MHHTTYNREFWDAYADENEKRYDCEFASRISAITSALQCAQVLEIGCGTGIDLRLLPDGISAYGLDPNSHALAIAKDQMPAADFARGMITRMPFADSAVDLVFTHGLLNYLDDRTLECAMREMCRVARKYVISCEWYAGGRETADGPMRSLDMTGRWARMGAVIMTDAAVHVQDTNKEYRFMLVRVMRPD